MRVVARRSPAAPHCAMEAQAFRAPWARVRPRRSAAERRAQRQRAQFRAVQHLLRGFKAITDHRGGTPSLLAGALASALRGPASSMSAASAASAAEMPLSSAPAAAAASAASTAAAPTYEDKEAAVAEYENVGKEKEQDAKYKSLQQQWRRMRQHENRIHLIFRQ